MPTKVLCVDDVSAMRQFLKFVLAGIPDVQIDLAEDGVAALKALRRERYDLVLLDLNLPLLNGMKVLSATRSEELNRATPVLIVTSEGHETTAEQARRLGATEVLTKPVQAERLTAAVKQALDLPGEDRPEHEQRRAARLRIPVRVEMPGEPPIEATTWDVNPFGAFVCCPPRPRGTRLSLVLDLPLVGEIAVDAEVVHARERAAGSLPTGIGVRFTTDADARRRLHDAFISPPEDGSD